MVRAWSLRREMLIALLVLAITVVILPGMIYLVGGALFGAYGSEGGMPGIYAATLSDLWVPRFAAWALLLTPVVAVSLLRALFYFTRSSMAAPEVAPARRREPTVSR